MGISSDPCWLLLLSRTNKPAWNYDNNKIKESPNKINMKLICHKINEKQTVLISWFTREYKYIKYQSNANRNDHRTTRKVTITFKLVMKWFTMFRISEKNKWKKQIKPFPTI